ncbi:flavodoxin domain-containing protein [Pseudomonas sp. LRF_L74]|uniref:flavodoxin domain-containing protein n=1 Tax=Pseudomonas sp. LRF_L74 TaxID=3369422 RepID=UPI003F5DD638
MDVQILFGTESGNAELVAEDIAQAVADTPVRVQVRDLIDLDPAELDPTVFYLLICSTHGEGELPSGAQPFAAALETLQPNLQGLRFAAFGLGDSSYAHYSRGVERLAEQLQRLSAERLGAFGRHDASSRVVASEAGIEWARGVLAMNASIHAS